MAETQNRRSPVALAFVLVLLTAGALVGAFYYAGGPKVAAEVIASDQVSELLASARAWIDGLMGVRTTTPESVTPTAAPSLTLPSGVDRDFALRLWQEQLDSQKNIRHLVDGDIRAFDVGRASYEGTSGEVLLTVEFADGTKADGALHMAKLGENWYVQYISGAKSGGGLASGVASGGKAPTTPLPALDAVDAGVLNAVMAEQVRSQAVFEDYLRGNVQRIVVTDVEKGPRTATINVKMYEKDETVDARIIALARRVDYEETWFLARFEKMKTTPKG